jgi:hypothetical protein
MCQIHSRGILELARQLPRIQSLSTVAIDRNPWLWCDQAEECGVALALGTILLENYSVEDLESRLYGKFLLLEGSAKSFS